MRDEVERFLGASRGLADVDRLPQQGYQRQERFDVSGVDRIVLGRMLAQVAIVPMAVDAVTLIGYGGDKAMLSSLSVTAQGGSLVVEGQVPFKSDASRGVVGNVVFGDNMSVTNVFGSTGSFTNVTVNSVGGGATVIVVDGREVDLGRSVQVGLVVPQSMDVKVAGIVGAVGIADHLSGVLDFSPAMTCDLYARSVASLTGDLSGASKAVIERVDGDAEIEVSGAGTVEMGAVSGAVEARVSGSGEVSVAGGVSARLRARVSGSGDVRHGGTVTGDARLRVSGSGEIRVSRVEGSVDQQVTGSGEIRVAGKRPGSRW